MKRQTLLAACTTVGVLGFHVFPESLREPSNPAKANCPPEKILSQQAKCGLGKAGLWQPVVPPAAQLPAPVAPQPEATPQPTAPVPAPPAVPNTAPAPVPPQQEEPTGTSFAKGRVYVLGDSLTNGTSKQNLGRKSLESKLAGNGWTSIRVRAACGRPLMGIGTFSSCDAGRPARLSATRQLEADWRYVKRSEVIVIALGTNDYMQNSAVFKKKAQSMVSKIHKSNPAARIIWPNIYIARRGDSYKNINTAIRNLKGVNTIDYASKARAYYKAGHSDGAHPSPEGYVQRAKIITAKVGVPAG